MKINYDNESKYLKHYNKSKEKKLKNNKKLKKTNLLIIKAFSLIFLISIILIVFMKKWINIKNLFNLNNKQYISDNSNNSSENLLNNNSIISSTTYLYTNINEKKKINLGKHLSILSEGEINYLKLIKGELLKKDIHYQKK